MKFLLDTNAVIAVMQAHSGFRDRSLTLITHNRREFDRISGLKIEDWP